MRRDLISIAVSAVLLATPAVPCAFHSYTPQTTFVERLLGSDHIVLARPTHENPFRFGQITVLEGGPEFVEIPHLVDSTTRRQLAANPDDHILFARDGAYGPWLRIAYVDSEMDQVLQATMAKIPEWEMGGDEERFAYFASLLNHPKNQIHALALRELDLADYGILRRLPVEIDAKRLVPRLNDRMETDLKPIRILLLGLAKQDGLERIFEAGVESGSKFAGAYLGAYATAMIEYGGPAAAQRLVSDYVMNSALDPISREMIIEALAIHSTMGNSETQEVIQALMTEAVHNDPRLATLVARQFGARYDWSQGTVIDELIRSGSVSSPIEMLLLTQYVSLAKENDISAGN